jgi:hypothetical protein
LIYIKTDFGASQTAGAVRYIIKGAGPDDERMRITLIPGPANGARVGGGTWTSAVWFSNHLGGASELIEIKFRDDLVCLGKK